MSDDRRPPALPRRVGSMWALAALLSVTALAAACDTGPTVTITGGCTLDLMDSERRDLAQPYEATIGRGGVARIGVRGSGWSGEVGRTQTAPNGWQEFGSVAGDAINNGGVSLTPNIAGLWRFTFRDAAGCSAELEVNVLPRPDSGDSEN